MPLVNIFHLFMLYILYYISPTLDTHALEVPKVSTGDSHHNAYIYTRASTYDYIFGLLTHTTHFPTTSFSDLRRQLELSKQTEGELAKRNNVYQKTIKSLVRVIYYSCAEYFLHGSDL